ncbi:glycosyltransferase [Neobacillus sp. MM2021_6]|uniref:glycosyltransferase n=1 Tax=Bacillaceae TaxID=186817 RepID=UPI00140CB6FE|nr:MULTISPECIES: glycosyltransferase [Bacillaceae]MBO0962929.1 glycosyltransferase [Neobacillus sp. MM2021_6]NHC19052.1 glycosyltransferase [Bacillus sp. MM2020_4]
MKKKLVFMLINMNVGGTEKALLNMLSEIPSKEYDITLLLLEEYGGFLNSVPKDIHVDYLPGYLKMKNILNQPLHIVALNFLRKGRFVKAFIIILLHLISKITKERSIIFKYALKDYQDIETEYDVAIAYAGPMDFISYFVINKVKAKKKVQWIHFDVTRIGFNQKFAKKIYKKFDKLFVVSNEGRKKIIDYLPNLNEKVDTFFNLISQSSIVKMANDGVGFEDHFKGLRILTVGRLTKEKGQDLTIPVLAKLKEDGYNVRWYCIGDGRDKGDYEKLVEVYNVKEDFIFLGANTNPYSFMKQCDLYVQPSRHEGYCITLTEAKCFNKPIISTNFTGACEQIIHNHTGLIVNFDAQEMYLALKQLLDDENLKRRLEENSRLNKINTTTEIQKLFNIVPN